MKSRIIGSLLVVMAVGFLAYYTSEDQPPRQSPAPEATDSSFRNLNIQ